VGLNQSSAKINSKWIDTICLLLIMLFVYTASSKLMDFGHFKVQMNNQTLPHGIAEFLIYTLPGIEILTSLLLIFSTTRLPGLYIAFILMLLFTGYVGLVLINYFGRVPCSCGGVLKMMGWKTHFIFNLFFLLLTATGIYITDRERRGIGKES
jgi:putative oxidoreductase